MKSSMCLFVFLFLLFPFQVFAQGLPFGALNGDSLPLTLQLESLGYPSLKTERSDETVGHLRGEAFIPISTSDLDAYALQIRTSRLTLDGDRSTGAANGLVPRELGSVSVGPFFRRKFETGDIAAGDVQLGRSGVELGRAETATTVSANFFWARPKNEDGGQWLYLLSYSNSRSTLNNIPLPGFAYMKPVKTESTQGFWAAGAPFFFTMLRFNPWSFTALLTPFTSFVEGGYSIAGPFSVFARFGWQPQAFKLNGGPSERILYEEFRTQLGVRGPVARWLMATVGVAYSDGRRVVWGDSLTKATEYESRLQDEISLFTNLSARF